MENDELRQQMSDAWDESEKDGDEAAELKSESLESNDDVNIGSDENAEKEPVLEEKEGSEATESAAKDEKAEEPVAKATGAPASWGAKAREDWAKVPAAAQAQIAKRETEVNQVLQQSAQAKKGMDSLNAVLAPYSEGLQSAGHTDPFSAMSSLLQVESGLRTGSSFDRAQGIANLISHYGVDIAQLDGILSGSQQQATQNPNSAMEDLLDQRMAPINQFLHQQQQQQQYGEIQQQQQATQSVAEFGADKEFLADVRMDMADLMDMAGKRGEQMTLDQAYVKACAINPEISQIMQQRTNQQTIMGTNNNAAQKRAASVSLTGTQGGAGGLDGTLSMRDTIAEAWNTQTG